MNLIIHPAHGTLTSLLLEVICLLYLTKDAVLAEHVRNQGC